MMHLIEGYLFIHIILQVILQPIETPIDDMQGSRESKRLNAADIK